MVVQKVEQHSSSIGFLGLLTIVLVVLKTTGFIDWSWWWVWLPIYIIPVIILLVLLGVGGYIAVTVCYDHYAMKKRRKKRDGF